MIGIGGGGVCERPNAGVCRTSISAFADVSHAAEVERAFARTSHDVRWLPIGDAVEVDV